MMFFSWVKREELNENYNTRFPDSVDKVDINGLIVRDEYIDIEREKNIIEWLDNREWKRMNGYRC